MTQPPTATAKTAASSATTRVQSGLVKTRVTYEPVTRTTTPQDVTKQTWFIPTMAVIGAIVLILIIVGIAIGAQNNCVC